MSSSTYVFISLTSFLTFGARFVLAGRNSYWLDELYSVERYTVQHGSLLDAMRDLADTSIHPPLYQAVLYVWVELFGDREVATRTLSNIAATIAVIALHQTALRIFGRRVANAAALTLALSYLVTYYGMETRSYAFSLMLSAVSSFAFLAFLNARRLQNVLPWHWPQLWPIAVLFGANLGLLFTHYYNFYFWGAQALFLATILVVTERGRALAWSLVAAVGFYASQVVIFYAVWGRITLDSYRATSEGFTTDTVSFTPLQILRSVMDRSFNFGPLTLATGLAIVVALVAWKFIDDWPNRRDHAAGRRLASGSYFLAMAIGPPVLAYVSFEIIGAEKFSARYMLYLMPSLVLLVTLAGRQVLIKTFGLMDNRLNIASRDHLHRHAIVYTLVFVAFLVGPGAIRGATEPKSDWRGTAEDLAAVARANPGAEYIVFETSFRSTPVYDYYLRRYGDDLRIAGTIRRGEERRGEFGFEDMDPLIRKHDYMVVLFAHHAATNFPTALARLEQRYELHHAQLNADDKGLVIFDVHDGG